VFNLSYLAAYLLGTALVIGVGYVWCKTIAGQDDLTATFNVIGMSCANSGFIGYPVLLMVLPAIAGNVLALNMLVENLLIIPFLLFMAERGRNHDVGGGMILSTLYGLRTNPVVIGIVGGVLLSVSGLSLPSFVGRCIDLLASASSATSLFVIGGTLVGISVKEESLQSAPVIIGKLILHPMLVFAALLVLEQAGLPPLAPPYKISILVMAATPMMGIYPTLAQAYGRETSSAMNMLLATILSFFTLSALLWCVQSLIVL
jgi:malonate transporter